MSEFVVALKPPITSPDRKSSKRIGTAETMEAAELLAKNHIGAGNRVLLMERVVQPDGGTIMRLIRAWTPAGEKQEFLTPTT